VPDRRRSAHLGGDLAGGYYVQPTLFKGHNKMRIFQEEIFGPVLAVTTFKDEAEALAIANDTLYGLGAGVWSRNGNVAYRMGRAIKAGRVWTNCYHAYPAHAAFGGYKESGIGRETHKVMLDHYQQTKNLLVSYSEAGLLLKLGFFWGGCRPLFFPWRRQAWSTIATGRTGTDRFPEVRSTARADVPPVRRLLRQQRRQLLPARRAHHGRRRRLPRPHRRLPVLHRQGAVRHTGSTPS
jgi:hypothetical protein